jgi:amino acid transporter
MSMGENMDFTNVIGLIIYMLIYYGLVFLVKKVIWAKLSEAGKDRFDMVSELGLGWVIFTYYMFSGIVSFIQKPAKNIFYIIIGAFIFLTLISYYAGKAKVNKRKRKTIINL